MTKKLVWILGASDPEMEMIEHVLRAHDQSITYAAADGKRVFPGNAYKATGILMGGKTYVDVSGIGDSICVECGFPGLQPAHVVDHHRPGDPGYGKGPEQFWEASSVGQTVNLLRQMLGTEVVTIPSDALLAAAADHCLAHAYAGRCPSIDPDELMRWRIASRAKFQRKDPATLLTLVEVARAKVRERAVETKYGLLADFGEENVAELPEAASREGIAFLGTGLPGPDGRRKKVIMGGSPEMIRHWMDTCNLRDVYGDPARGFAGGYLE